MIGTCPTTWFSMAAQLAIIVAQRPPRFELPTFWDRMGQNGQNGRKLRPLLVCHGDSHFLEFRLSAQHYPERSRGSPPTTQVGVGTLPIPIVEGRRSRLAEEYGSKNLIFGRFSDGGGIVYGDPPKSSFGPKKFFFKSSLANHLN